MLPLALLLFFIAIIAVHFNLPGFALTPSSIAGAALIVCLGMLIGFTIVAFSRRWPLSAKNE